MSEPTTATTGELTTPRRFGRAAFGVTFVSAFILFLLTVSPILPPVLLGGLLAAFTAPLRNRIEQRYPGRRVAAAAITVFIVLAVLVPLGILSVLIAQQLVSVAGRAPEIVQALEPHGALQRWVETRPLLRELVPSNLAVQVAGAIRWVASRIPGLLAGFLDTLLAVFLTLVTTYFLLRDGPWILVRLERALPLEPRHTRAIVTEFKGVSRAVILGHLGTAAAQGVVAGLGYWALGLPEPMLLGALTCITSLVPVLGSGLVWVPLAAWQLIAGNTSKGLLLLAFGVLVVGTVDNLLRPILSREGLQVHPLMVFLGIFGGLAAFGPSGIYIGPVVVALFLALARIYERELAPAATAQSEPEPPEGTLTWKLAQALGRSLRRRAPPASQE